jgi:hypothetical protein
MCGVTENDLGCLSAILRLLVHCGGCSYSVCGEKLLSKARIQVMDREAPISYAKMSFATLP